jgi:hypothetical protein
MSNYQIYRGIKIEKNIYFFLVVPLLFMTSCSNDVETLHVVNAEILEISNFVKGMVVKGLDNNSILGDKCYINCENPEVYFIYVDYDTGEVTDIEFEDLKVGDRISVDVKSVENKYALAYRVQLLTQRR